MGNFMKLMKCISATVLASMLVAPVMADSTQMDAAEANMPMAPFVGGQMPMMRGMYPAVPGMPGPSAMHNNPSFGSPMPMMGMHATQGPSGMAPNPQMMREMMQSHMSYLHDMDVRIRQLEAQVQELQKR
jgi:hypothetical protein